MVFNFDPLDITLAFERRPYMLGDTINATVTLFPNGNVDIREATLNLVAEVSRMEVKMGRTMDMGGASTLQGGIRSCRPTTSPCSRPRNKRLQRKWATAQPS